LRRWIPIPLREMLACTTGASGGASLPALTSPTERSHAIQLTRTLHNPENPTSHNKSDPPRCPHLARPPVGTVLRSTVSSFVVGWTAKNMHKP
jgi:hypothetical protein